MCGEVPSEVDKLLRTTTENYYQVLSTFVHVTRLRNRDTEDEDPNGRPRK